MHLPNQIVLSSSLTDRPSSYKICIMTTRTPCIKAGNIHPDTQHIHVYWTYIKHYILQPPTLLLIRPPISPPLSLSQDPGPVAADLGAEWFMSRVEGMCMSTTRLFSFMLSTHTHTCTHMATGAELQRSTWHWRRPLLALAPDAELCPVAPLCGHRLIYGLLDRNRHAIAFSLYRTV